MWLFPRGVPLGLPRRGPIRRPYQGDGLVPKRVPCEGLQQWDRRCLRTGPSETNGLHRRCTLNCVSRGAAQRRGPATVYGESEIKMIALPPGLPCAITVMVLFAFLRIACDTSTERISPSFRPCTGNRLPLTTSATSVKPGV